METKLSITEKEVSQAIVFLLQEVRELKEVVNGKGSVERVPIGIKEACIILQKAKQLYIKWQRIAKFHVTSKVRNYISTKMSY